MENNTINTEQITDDVAKNTSTKNRYIKLRRELNELCDSLYEGKVYIDEAKTQLKKNYTIDEESADQNKLNKVSSDIEETLNYIRGKVIPSINQEINELNTNITTLNELLDSEETI